MERVVVAIYIDPDFYPPTINAILNFAERAKEVVVVTRNNSKADFPFPKNVTLHKVGDFISVRDSEKQGLKFKVTSFLNFTRALLKFSRNSKTELVVLYDAIPLLSFFLVSKLLGTKKKIWYHNHDMPDKAMAKKYSIGWFSANYERKAMEKINYFSLPSADRLQFYPGLPPYINYFTIPNYPSKKVYLKENIHQRDPNKIKIIFQGFIGKGLALEELIGLLGVKINGANLHLTLKGSVNPDYKASLQLLAKQLGVEDKLDFVGIGPYIELPPLTAQADIGIAMYIKGDNVSRTLGTASNKIYEYAASGLPVILYKIEQFEKYLGKYAWTFFSDGTSESIKENIERIMPDLSRLSVEARKDFEQELNFEGPFGIALDKVANDLKV